MQIDHTGRIVACPLFKNLDKEKMQKAADFFHSRTRKYGKGESLKHPGERLTFFGFVLSGAVEVYMDDIDGNHLVMAFVKEGNTFGESLCYLGKPNPVGIVAVDDCEILLMDCLRLRKGSLENSIDQEFVSRFIAMLASRTLEMNERIQILSRLTIREKLLTYFARQETYAAGRNFKIPMDREHLAAYLGVNRSALSRELARMKKEGFIDYYKNSFRILK